jgi:ELWxxDGT repeat protein
MLAFNGGILCQATLPGTGAELYFSNGSQAGSGLLQDIWPGPASSNVAELTLFGSQAVFSATNPVKGREPWITSGSASGTNLLADVAFSPLDQSSGASDFIRLGQRAIFQANDGLTGYELWATDGSASGTTRLTDFKGASGSLSGGPLANLVYRDRVYLPLDDGQRGVELWATDGTAAGTQLAVDLNPGAGSSNPRPLLVWRDELYFSASTTGSFVFNLFATNGQPGGTRQVTFFGPFTGIDQVSAPVEHQGRLYFLASTPATGLELWSTDGTPTGLLQVTELAPGSQSGVPSFAAASFGPWLYFAGRTANSQVELFRTNGTPAGTSLFADLNGALSSNPGSFAQIGNRLVFSASVSGQFQYFSTDGNAVQQLTFPPLYVNWNQIGRTKSKLIGMLRGNGGSFHLWGSDGTPAGSGVIAQIAPDGDDFVNFRAWPVSSGEKLLFAAGNSAVGSEIFVTDGVSAGPLIDLIPGDLSSSPEDVVRVADKLIFGAYEALTGFELYSLPFSLVGDYVAQPYGQGCLGSNGLEPKISASGAAIPGGNLSIDVSATAPFAPLAHYWSPGFGLLKLGNCSVYLATPLFLGGQSANGSGSASLPIAIPNNPSLIGQGLWWQTLAIDPGAEFLGLAALTAALELRF